MTYALCQAIVMRFVIFVRMTRPRRARKTIVSTLIDSALVSPWTPKLNDAKKKRWVICSKIRRSKSCDIKARGRCPLYSLVIFIVTAANDASSLSFLIRERGTEQKRHRAGRPIRTYARRGSRWRWCGAAGRGEEKHDRSFESAANY